MKTVDTQFHCAVCAKISMTVSGSVKCPPRWWHGMLTVEERVDSFCITRRFTPSFYCCPEHTFGELMARLEKPKTRALFELEPEAVIVGISLDRQPESRGDV